MQNVMESAARKEEEDRELLRELEMLKPEMRDQLVGLVGTIAASSAHHPKGPRISAAGHELLAALHGSAKGNLEGPQCVLALS
jgi:hypothetical protein